MRLRVEGGPNLRIGPFADFEGLARTDGFAAGALLTAPAALTVFSASALAARVLAALALDGVVLAMRELTLGPPRP